MMFEAEKAMFLYAVSPVHMGAGTGLGAIDNPIQRERHTSHPMIAGSGLKGAFRSAAGRLEALKGEVARIFGPGPSRGDASEHAGNLAIADAQLVLFPVRSLKQSYVYATCPTALGRLQRLLGRARVGADWTNNPIPLGKDSGERSAAVVADRQVVEEDGRVILESYEFAAVEGLAPVAEWLAEAALPADPSLGYFRQKIRQHTVLLSDQHFGFFVKNATLVEPHVRIDDDSGTAADGGLFYTENVPPESLFVSLVMSAKERISVEASSGGASERRTAQDTMGRFAKSFEGKMLQVGGDATSGRGQVLVRFAGGAA